MSGSILCACVLVTLIGALWRPLHDGLSGIAPREHPWQPLTAVFVHGWPGVPAALHLALNAMLILTVGAACERLLGRGRFAALCAASLAANAFAIVLTEGVDGSSLVIWSWGPPLALALGVGRGSEPAHARGPARERLVALLLVMYVGVTGLMAALPYAQGWRGNPLSAFLLGNRYHLIATAVGVAAAWAWRRAITERADLVLGAEEAAG